MVVNRKVCAGGRGWAEEGSYIYGWTVVVIMPAVGN